MRSLVVAALALQGACALATSASLTSEQTLYNEKAYLIPAIRSAMQASIRTSWEQGVAGSAILEIDYPEYTVFGANPFVSNGTVPISPLQFALSAAVRQGPDGRLSQLINDGDDGAALDGASAAPLVLLGSYTQSSRASYWSTSAAAQLDYLLYTAPRTSTGAISHRNDAKQYWSDGVYMGFPFLSMYGLLTTNETLIQLGYTECKLYRNALRRLGPYGYLWGHVYSDDTQSWVDPGLWSSGNAWAALGMFRVAVIISKSAYPMPGSENWLLLWTKEILDSLLPAITSAGLLPDYVPEYGGATFNDVSASAAIASVCYRAVTLYPSIFGANYTTYADTLRDAVVSSLEAGFTGDGDTGLNTLGVLAPVVNPVNTEAVGILSTEAQSFGLMMFAAWQAYAFQ